MKFLQALAGSLSGLAIAAALAAVPDITPAEAATSPAAPAVAQARPVAHPGAARPAAASRGWSPPGDAATTPTQRAIAAAVRDSEVTADVPDDAYTVRSISVAQGGRWATAMLVPNDPDEVDGAVVLVQRRSAHWHVADLGTFEVGCGIAPSLVLRELRLTCG
ncbi:hypothetical protein BJY21_000544 [Kineosphaera limosa]|uniref:Uncharacterized protein n=1 Tax=Kineosphaera limosa NBRC 100340 TaxID=1184609 RepID=K6X798_9MICO|nr:hypothetical protein [Kineosphaera limosa]NYD99359.1 hypothetical protein [Kineosphaera limosa]GAB94684.1 hypothetical protein KILIM_010_00150 [Kineosphaera limosa NBRC 100340]